MRRALFVLIALTWTACRVQNESSVAENVSLRDHEYEVMGAYSSATRRIQADQMIVRGACVEFLVHDGMLVNKTSEVICNAGMSVKVIR